MAAPIRQLAPSEYPPQLLQIPQVPERLWMRGSWPPKDASGICHTRYLAIVGSRALSRYGKEACEMLIGGLAGYPVSVVSGLALGADACAHRAALDAELHTIAIPGSGLGDNVLYPRANARLAQEILESGGALLSEHEEAYIAHPYDFPSRNRLMVGLADAVLVVEAGERSGTLITARLAGEYSRDLLCIPHRIGDPHGFAANIFLRIGAAHVTEPMHILEALGIAPREEDVRDGSAGSGAGAGEARAARLSIEERAVYRLLAEPRPRDELIRASGIPSTNTLTILISLELQGLIKEEFGLWRRA